MRVNGSRITVNGLHGMVTIDTFADFLNVFVDKQNEVLLSQDIKHPTSIGAMYEGLSEKILKASIFKGIDLRVIKNSHIKGCNTEFDVMIVEGEGEQLPFAERYEYPASQVLAVVQVKKNLYAADLRDSFANLQFVIDQYRDVEPEQWMNKMFVDAVKGVIGKSPGAKSRGYLNEYEEMVWHTLRCESFLPLRIVMGYNGFTSEYNFRKSFVDYLKQNMSTEEKRVAGFGPNNYPNLIICDEYSMIKMDGMPFISRLDEDNWWTFYATSHYNKMRFLIESLWTRLSYKYQLPSEIFGEDLQKEPATVFLRMKYEKKDFGEGWALDYWDIKDKNLKGNSEPEEWEPVAIDSAQYVIITELGSKGRLNWVHDEGLSKFVMSEGYQSVEEFVKKLCDTGLVGCEGEEIYLLTKQCTCVCAEGRWYAADAKDNRLMNWSLKQMGKQKN